MIAAIIEQPAPESRRILIVDDEPALLMLVADALTDEGHEVRLAATGVQALELLDSWLPDVILLDLTLPEMSGREFRERQRALPGPHRDVPVIVVTGAHQQDDLVEDLGAIGLLSKPFDLDALVTLVNEVDVGR
jgi:CheY-like chemotaxis protein